MNVESAPLDPGHEARRGPSSRRGASSSPWPAPFAVSSASGMFVSVFFSDPFDGLTGSSGDRDTHVRRRRHAPEAWAPRRSWRAIWARSCATSTGKRCRRRWTPPSCLARHGGPRPRPGPRRQRWLGRRARLLAVKSTAPHTCGTVNDADDVFCKGCGEQTRRPGLPSRARLRMTPTPASATAAARPWPPEPNLRSSVPSVRPSDDLAP